MHGDDAWFPGCGRPDPLAPDDVIERIAAHAVMLVGGPSPCARNGRAPKPAPAVAVPLEGEDDPHRLARLFVSQGMYGGLRTLAYHSDVWHRWAGGAYRPVAAGELKAQLSACIKEEYDRLVLLARAAWEAMGGRGSPPVTRRVTGRLVGDVEQALRSIALVPGDVQPPAWLPGHAGPPPYGLLVCRNGVVDLDALDAGKPHLRPLTPALFTPTALPLDFDLKAPPPTLWLSFLKQLWPEDRGEAAFLREWAGYLLTPDTSLQKAAFLVGPKRSGKGTICRILTALVGANNVANPTLGSLGLPFGLQPLLGKSAAFVTDARLDGRADGSLIVERLLSITGEDGQTIDRKHLTSVNGKLPVRFTLVSNELPRLIDSSGALAGRLVILQFVQSFFGSENPRLTEALMGELPGILLWALEGRRTLRERGRFQAPESSADLAREMEELASPITAFIRERCEIGHTHTERVDEAWKAWGGWAKGHGQAAGSKQSFGRDLRSALPALRTRQVRYGGGHHRVFLGLRLKADEDGAEGDPG